MRITEDHWLEAVDGTDDPKVTRQPLPGGSVMEIRRFGVVHFTDGASGQSSIDFWRTPEAAGACAHVVIEREGQVIQIRPFNRTCGHAGKSKWRDPKTGQMYVNVNSCSIGIELANAGSEPEQLAWARQHGFQAIAARHRNGGPLRTWEVFPEAQLRSLAYVAGLLTRRYHLDDWTGHDCISPARRDDPGPAFPMQQFREGQGFEGLPTVYP